MTQVNGMKNTIIQVTHILNCSMINLLFYCHIILYQEEIISYNKFSKILTLQVQIGWKIPAF